MHKQGKNPCIFLSHTIEHHHGDDGKMPRTGTVGRRNNDGNGTHHKHHQGSHHSQIRRKAETEESDIEFQEIACPDTYRVQKEKRHVMDMAQGKDAFPYVLQDTFQPGKGRHIAYQEKG